MSIKMEQVVSLNYTLDLTKTHRYFQFIFIFATHKYDAGVVEFLRLEDMKYAIRKLDDSRFKSHEVNL